MPTAFCKETGRSASGHTQQRAPTTQPACADPMPPPISMRMATLQRGIVDWCARGVQQAANHGCCRRWGRARHTASQCHRQPGPCRAFPRVASSAAGAQGGTWVPGRSWSLGCNKVWLILGKQGPKCCARPAASCLPQMVAALEIPTVCLRSDDCQIGRHSPDLRRLPRRGIDFEAVAIASSPSPPPLFPGP